MEGTFLSNELFWRYGYSANCHGFWVVPYGEKAIGHGGNTAGCSSYLLIEPESGVGVVVMTKTSRRNLSIMKI